MKNRGVTDETGEDTFEAMIPREDDSRLFLRIEYRP